MHWRFSLWQIAISGVGEVNKFKEAGVKYYCSVLSAQRIVNGNNRITVIEVTREMELPNDSYISQLQGYVA
jgi:hypothetical protein